MSFRITLFSNSRSFLELGKLRQVSLVQMLIAKSVWTVSMPLEEMRWVRMSFKTIDFQIRKRLSLKKTLLLAVGHLSWNKVEILKRKLNVDTFQTAQNQLMNAPLYILQKVANISQLVQMGINAYIYTRR